MWVWPPIFRNFRVVGVALLRTSAVKIFWSAMGYKQAGAQEKVRERELEREKESERERERDNQLIGCLLGCLVHNGGTSYRQLYARVSVNQNGPGECAERLEKKSHAL